MRVVSTRDACRLTGLSTNKLREWTSRRALIPADIRPKSQGSPAKYSWQTILLLRIAVTLRDGFHLELQAYRPVLASLRGKLRNTSFVALWGKSLAIHTDHSWVWLDDADAPLLADALVIRLDQHLDILSQGFALPRPSAASGQLDFFPAQAIAPAQSSSQHPAASRPLMRRRRSA
jgi:DNA-binding transcriptional MerR regulator